MLHGTGGDFRYVLRVLARSPGFTLVAVLSLALGIGANTAMFGVVRTLLLTPLPVSSPEELALVGWDREGDFDITQAGATSYRDPETGGSYRSNLSFPIYQAMRGAVPDGIDVFAFAFMRSVSVGLDDRPASLAGGALVDGAYFPVLGVPMALGRPIGPADDRAGAPLVVVLSHTFWMRTFGGDPAVVGRTIRLNGAAAEVIGVTREGFRGLSMGGFFPQTDVTVPLSAQPTVYPRISGSEASLFTSEDVFWLRVMARIGDGRDRPAVEAPLAAALASAPSPVAAADDGSPILRLLPGAHGAQPVGQETARLLWLLLAVVGVVLLIACANLAGLMLARGVARQREMAVRRALGGGRGRLLRQAAMEGLVLAGAGTAAGLVLAWLGRGSLSELLTGSLGAGSFGSVEMRPSFDPVVLGVTVALGATATVLFGILPALRLTDADPVTWLKDRAAGTANPRLTAGRVLLAAQIAVSVPLVVGAALFLRTAQELGSVELGFEPEGLRTFQIDPAFAGIPEEAYPSLYQELLASLEQVRGVRSVTLMENALLSGIVSNTFVTLSDVSHQLYLNAVGPSFLETLGTELLVGRVPGIQDGPEAPRVAAVNEAAVRTLFDGASPLGRTLRVGSRDVLIVGVVRDTPYRNRRDPVPPVLYESALQRNGFGGHHVVLRAAASAPGLEGAVREAVSRVHPDLPVPELRLQSDLIDQTSARERAFTRILSLFGAFALLLASIGLHGATSYSVARRTSEIGVRMAVGARPGAILWMVLRDVMVLVGFGLALGIPAAVLAGPLVGSLLYGVSATSGSIIAGTCAVLLGVALLAGTLPALRAARLSPTVALGTD